MSVISAKVFAPHARPVQIRSLLDALPGATAVFDTNTRQIHFNRGLQSMLRQDPESQIVDRALRELGGTIALERTEHTRDVNTIACSYRARGSFLQVPLIGNGDSAVISIEQLADILPSENRLRMHFGLTEQEARVALLLAQRVTTDELAARLGITKHTVRRHVERVLAKLQVGTRADVRELVIGLHRV